MRERLDCRLLRSTPELEGFATEWRELWQKDPSATPFQSPDWLLPWWHQFGQPDVRAVVLSRGESIIGLLPFYVYPEPRSGERQMLLIGVGTTDYLDGIFAPQCSVEDVAAGLKALCAEAGWDVLTALQLRPGSKLCHAFELMGAAARFESDACSRTTALRISDLPQKLRRNTMYYRNRAMRGGELTLTMAGDQDWEEAFTALHRLHNQRWRERGESGVLTDERVLAWHREALPLLMRANMLRLCCLRLNGEIVAVMYSVADPAWRTQRTEYVYLTAYSTAHRELRPGTMLLAMESECAANQGIRMIDMLRGSETYKHVIWHMERSATYGFALRNKAGVNRTQLAMGAVA